MAYHARGEHVLENTVTITEAARQLGLANNTVRYHILRGSLETVWTPLGRLVEKDSLAEFAKGRELEAQER